MTGTDTSYFNDAAMARKFAIRAHGDQKYGKEPYVVHLDQVVELCKPYPLKNLDIVAYLHDVMEDTSTTEEEIASNFGIWVAECVEMLTDPPGLNRKIRKAALHARLSKLRSSSSTYPVLIVKAADRLANIQQCIKYRDTRLLMYKKEHDEFKNAVYREVLNKDLFDEMDKIL